MLNTIKWYPSSKTAIALLFRSGVSIVSGVIVIYLLAFAPGLNTHSPVFRCRSRTPIDSHSITQPHSQNIYCHTMSPSQRGSRVRPVRRNRTEIGLVERGSSDDARYHWGTRSTHPRGHTAWTSYGTAARTDLPPSTLGLPYVVRESESHTGFREYSSDGSFSLFVGRPRAAASSVGR